MAAEDRGLAGAVVPGEQQRGPDVDLEGQILDQRNLRTLPGRELWALLRP